MEEVLGNIMGASPIADEVIDKETGKFKEESELYIVSNSKGIMGASSVLHEGYVDTGIKIIISVVIGGIILAGLYALFNTSIIPTMKTKVTEMFNYAG